AEDGIRDKLVTGVQTCALPISLSRATGATERRAMTTIDEAFLDPAFEQFIREKISKQMNRSSVTADLLRKEPGIGKNVAWDISEIGRASCRERVEKAACGRMRK